jgi:hypothetical protein
MRSARLPQNALIRTSDPLQRPLYLAELTPMAPSSTASTPHKSAPRAGELGQTLQSPRALPLRLLWLRTRQGWKRQWAEPHVNGRVKRRDDRIRHRHDRNHPAPRPPPLHRRPRLLGRSNVCQSRDFHWLPALIQSLFCIARWRVALFESFPVLGISQALQGGRNAQCTACGRVRSLPIHAGSGAQCDVERRARAEM